jgi:hypothetical protein
MATLIPALSSCTSRMTTGERRLAERLESKLEEDYLLWYDVPVGPKQSHPDFVVIHPRRGVLILEVKDWKLSTIQRATRQMWEIIPDGNLKVVINPLAQARHCAIQVVNALERDPPLVQATGAHQGKLAFPWGFGVVLSNITRKQFTDAGLNEAIEPHHVICADEMTDAAEAEAFQKRLWNMFPQAFGGAITLPQLDRVRWIMFPEVRVQTQAALFDDSDTASLPDVMRVMDIQQEQLARSLGDGHRVIHGVAGSGKTMILGYRAQYLAKANAHDARPILVLCYNEPLAVKLATVMEAKGLSDKVHVRNFHKWCRQQLVAFGQALPAQGPGMFEEMVNGVIRGVERKQIPSGQYLAVMIDEGHDFEPEWLKLITQMVDPTTNSLLLLYDDAQAIYKKKRLKFTLKSVGIEATRGRSTILKINYRNTRQILQVASLFADEFLNSGNDDLDDDDSPRVTPVGCGREGAPPLVIRLPTLHAEATEIAERLSQAHQEGYAWSDMAVICRHYNVMEICAQALQRLRLPHQVRRKSGNFDPSADVIKVMTMHVSKGLEFPLVALPGLGQLPTPGEDELTEAQLCYVASTRATAQLILTSSADSSFSQRLEKV